MAVEQEMAEIYPPEAEDLSEFLPETDCGNCGFASCIEFAESVLEKETRPNKCPDLDDRFESDRTKKFYKEWDKESTKEIKFLESLLPKEK